MKTFCRRFEQVREESSVATSPWSRSASAFAAFTRARSGPTASRCPFAVEALASSPAVRAADAEGLDRLSKREMEVVRCLAQGLTNREIENFAKRLLVLRDERAAIAEITLPTAAPHSVIPMPRSRRADFISERVEHNTNQGIANLKSVARSAMGEAESIAISEALTHTRWHRKRAAELLDISYKALLYKIKQYDLERPMSQGAD